MPKDFTDCVKNGGRVVTKQINDKKYIHICYDKNGKPHSGEVKTKEKESSMEKEQRTIEESKELVQSLLELQKHFNSNYHA